MLYIVLHGSEIVGVMTSPVDAALIAKPFEALFAHRPNVAIQITDEYGKEPPNRSKNVIHDIPVLYDSGFYMS